jgi:L-alanine-DL-glutamate epimerase-like enolase superfamily enzyme
MGKVTSSVNIQGLMAPVDQSGPEEAIIEALDVAAYKIPTSVPEADGTIEWNSTTLIIVEIKAAGKKGIGYTYADQSTAYLISHKLKDLVLQKYALDIEGITHFLIHQIRNLGTCGVSMMAISAIDNALWDLKAKIFDLPLCKLLGQVRESMLIYGSGGFTTYSKKQLQQQFSNWAEEGIQYMKMKIGASPGEDVQRVRDAREVLNDSVQLMIDANGAYTAKEALQKANEVLSYNVTWFEEPVSSDNLEGLCFIREHAPPQINIAAGEYGYNLPYFKAMLHAGSVDVLQADATRCGGITGFLKAGILAEAYQLPFSSHCAPALHLHAALCLPSFYISEYFHDHVRIERMLFDGVPAVENGVLKPDLSRPGLGIEFRRTDAMKYKLDFP